MFLAVGSLTIAAARTQWGFRHGRSVASVSALASAAIMIATYLHGAHVVAGWTGAWRPAVELGVNLIFVQLVAVAVLPLKPIQMFHLEHRLRCSAFWVSFFSRVGRQLLRHLLKITPSTHCRLLPY